MTRSFSPAIAATTLSAAFPLCARDTSPEVRLRERLQHTLRFAAITGKRAVLCPSSDGRECTSTPDFSRSWIAFLDEDGNREHAASEALILTKAALPADVRLRSTLGRTRVIFPGSAVTFTLCDARGASHARSLIFAEDGRLRHRNPTAARVAATCVR